MDDKPEKQKRITPKTAWKPGQSGNPKGRPPKGETLTDALKQRVDKHEIAAKLCELAMGGDITALKYIYDRIDGRPIESVDMNHSGGIIVTFDEAARDV